MVALTGEVTVTVTGEVTVSPGATIISTSITTAATIKIIVNVDGTMVMMIILTMIRVSTRRC
jgi:hypothetical protein